VDAGSRSVSVTRRPPDVKYTATETCTTDDEAARVLDELPLAVD